MGKAVIPLRPSARREGDAEDAESPRKAGSPECVPKDAVPLKIDSAMTGGRELGRLHHARTMTRRRKLARLDITLEQGGRRMRVFDLAERDPSLLDSTGRDRYATGEDRQEPAGRRRRRRPRRGHP